MTNEISMQSNTLRVKFLVPSLNIILIKYEMSFLVIFFRVNNKDIFYPKMDHLIGFPYFDWDCLTNILVELKIYDIPSFEQKTMTLKFHKKGIGLVDLSYNQK